MAVTITQIPSCKLCNSDNKPSKPVIIEHTPRGSYRLEPMHVGRPKKRVRTPRTPREKDLGAGVVQSRGRRHIKLC